jgi:hypothetical protein
MLKLNVEKVAAGLMMVTGAESPRVGSAALSAVMVTVFGLGTALGAV